MATTPVPAFAAPPDFPALSDRATGTYNSKAYAWATAIQGSTGPNIHAIALTAKDNADDAALSTTAAAAQVVLAADQVSLAAAQALEASDQADRAQGMADAAIANAAYKGDWASLSGALAVPATVTHSGDRYVLLSNVANVTAHEPGVSAVWEKLTQAQEKLVSGTNIKTVGGQSLLGGGNIAVGDVSGPAGAVNLRIAIFDGATGKSIKDGGQSLPAGALVGLSDAQTLSGKTISFASNTLTGVQPTLVSGSNIKTFNGASILGSGNIVAGDVTTAGAQTLSNKTLVAPALGTPISGDLTNCKVESTHAVGFRNIPQLAAENSYTCALSDNGKHILHPSYDTSARTYTIPPNSSVPFPLGAAITFVNQDGTGGIVTINCGDTMRLAGVGTTGSRTLARNGIATALKITTTGWIISGSGLT